MEKKARYYIEVCCKEESGWDFPYSLQTKWFDDKEQAKYEFFKMFEFIEFDKVEVNVMSAFFDDEGEYSDILFEEKLDYRDKRKYSF